MTTLRIVSGFVLSIVVVAKTERGCIQYQNCPNLTNTVQQGNISEVAELLKVCDINSVNEDNRTALHWAAQMGRPDIVFLLLDRGADPHRADPSGLTPLHLAANFTQAGVAMEMVIQLLLRGARRMARDDRDRTALHFAASHGHISAARPLLTACDAAGRMEQLQSRDARQHTPVEHARLHEQHTAVAWLETVTQEAAQMATSSFDPNIQEPPYIDCRYITRYHNNITAIRIVVKACGVDRFNVDGTTTLLSSAEADVPDAVFTLLTYGADVNHMNKYSYNALHMAWASIESASLILLHQPDRFIKGGRTREIPLSYAASNANFTFARLLLSNCNAKCKLKQLDSWNVYHKTPADMALNVTMKTWLNKVHSEAAQESYKELKRKRRGGRSGCDNVPTDDGERAGNSIAQLQAHIVSIDKRLNRFMQRMYEIQNRQKQTSTYRPPQGVPEGGINREQ